MNKILYCLLGSLISGLAYSQTNIISNSSFETGSGSPSSPPSCAYDPNMENVQNSLNKNIDFWRNVGNGRTSDWIDYNNNCNFIDPIPHIPGNNRYIRMVNLEGVMQEFCCSQKLTAGHSYILKFRFAGVSTNAGLRIYFSKKNNFTWDCTMPCEKLEIVPVQSTQIQNFAAATWHTIERYFTVPKNLSDLDNIILVNDVSLVPGGMQCYLDDIELFDNGCCPEFMLYENTSSLPSITHVVKHINIGFDAGVDGTSGDVRVLPGQHVTFRGGQINLLPGFYAPTNAVTVIQPDPCTASDSPTLDPISASIIPNVITPNGDGESDMFCVTAQGALSYFLQVYNRFGNKVYEGYNTRALAATNNFTNNLFTNYYCIWNGTCNKGACKNGTQLNDGTYDYILELSNCSAPATYTGTVTILNDGRYMNDTITYSSQSEFIISPNPSNGVFALELKDDLFGEISIYNKMGQIVHKSTFSDSKALIDISRHTQGIYFIKVQVGDKIYTDKVIIQ